MNNNSGIRIMGGSKWWPLLLLPLLLSSCYEKEEGCLDTRAVNFDPGADVACEDCCTYPRLSLRVEHRLVFDDTIVPFRYDSLYSVDPFPDVNFRVHRLRYLISGIRLLNTEGEGRVTDTVSVYVSQNPGDTTSLIAINDFVLGDRSFLQAAQLGEWDGYGVFDRMEFIFGVDPALQNGIPSKMPSGHPLGAQAAEFNWEEGQGYRSNYFMYSLEDQPEDTIRVPMTVAVPVSVGLNPPLELRPGYNIQLSLFLNYLAWWEGLDLSSATPQQIEQRFATQASNALFSIEVRQ
ncbi:MAG: MbnP family protein [Saprospiraceae bacterium]